MILLVLPALIGVYSCSAKIAPENEEDRLALDAMAQRTVDELVGQVPGLESKMQNALAYSVVHWKLTKVPVFGMGTGEGVLTVTESDENIYFDATRFDVGGGLGKRTYKVLMIIDSQEVLEKAIGGTWTFLAGADTAGIVSSYNRITTASGDGYTLYVLHRTGTLVAVTARLVRTRKKW